MLRAIVIDDEESIRFLIQNRVAFSGLDIQFVGEAEDGEAGMEIFRNTKPDIVLTDIRMPGITGIELAKQINQMDYGAKIVFLTGYAEFEYARYGIEYKVFDYLLKPVDEQEAIKCINRAISAFHAEQKHTEMYQIFQDYFVKNQELIRQQFVEKLFFQPVIFFRKTDGTAKAEAADCNKWI